MVIRCCCATRRARSKWRHWYSDHAFLQKPSVDRKMRCRSSQCSGISMYIVDDTRSSSHVAPAWPQCTVRGADRRQTHHHLLLLKWSTYQIRRNALSAYGFGQICSRLNRHYCLRQWPLRGLTASNLPLSTSSTPSGSSGNVDHDPCVKGSF